MNNLFKRIGGVLIMILAALVLVASVGGVFGLWALNGNTDDLTAALFSPLESGLTSTNEVLAKVDTRITDARARVSNTQELVGQLGQDPAGNRALLGVISNT